MQIISKEPTPTDKAWDDLVSAADSRETVRKWTGSAP